MKSVLGVLSVIVCALSLNVTAAQRQTKPTRTFTVSTDSPLPKPQTLQQLSAQAMLIIDGTVVEEIPADVVMPTRPPRIVTSTLFTIQIRRVHKGRNLLNGANRLQIRMPVGIRDRGAYLEVKVQEGIPTPAVQERYLLFLSPSKNGEYELLAGRSDSLFLVANGQLRARGSSRASKGLDRMSVADFESRISVTGGGQ